MRKATRPLYEPMPKVAVVGAGVSGLTCARTLADHGFPVTVFEKSRGVGGRMATRRADNGLTFDHGAQYFTIRDKHFQRYVESWMHDGIVGPWRGRIVVLEGGVIKEEKKGTDRLVAVPTMNAVCRHLATDLDVRFQSRVAPLERVQGLWHVASDDGTDLGVFDVAIVTAPASQSAELLRAAPLLADQARQVEMHGCWAVMLSLSESLGLGFDGAFVHDSPISWIARNSSKPDRPVEPETWVLHASTEWSHAHLDDPAEAVESILRDEFWEAMGVPPRDTQYRAAHRWRFALPPEPLHESCLFDPLMRIGACGDWCAGPRVEGAFLSGMAVAGRVLGSTKP